MMADEGGNRVNNGVRVLVSTLVLIVSIGALLTMWSDTNAITREERRTRLEQRRAERKAERERRRQEREEQRDSDEEDEQGSEEQTCECSASLKLGRASLMWRGESLVFVPTVDIKIRTKGEYEAPDWHVDLNYDGVAHQTPFSGSDSWGGQCFDGRYSYSGHDLQAVTIGGLLRSMFGSDDEFEGLIRMNARLSGCDSDEEHRQMKFEIEEFGNLDTGSWRRVR